MFGRSKSKREPEELLEEELHAAGGRPALARVVAHRRIASSEGLTVAPPTVGLDRETVNELIVRIDPETEPSFEAALRVVTRLTSETAPYGYPPIAPPESSGREPWIPVIYDPADHTRIAYDRSPEGAQVLDAHLERTRPARPDPQPVRLDITTQMEALSDLRDRDALTEAEFEQRWHDLLRE